MAFSRHADIMFRITILAVTLLVAACADTTNLQPFYVLNKSDSQIEFVQVTARGLPRVTGQQLQGLAGVHCQGPAQLTGTRRLDPNRGGYPVLTFGCR